MKFGIEQYMLGAGLLAISVLLACTLGTGNFESVPTVVFGAITAILSYLAYRFSREKVRLELFDKRWAIYEETLKFCSLVTEQGTLRYTADNKDQIESAIKSAHSSFRGIGLHRASALFGPEIQKLFDDLNKSYSWLVTYSDQSNGRDSNWPQKHYHHLKFIWDTVQALPDVFKPYMYFGDIRNDHHYRMKQD